MITEAAFTIAGEVEAEVSRAEARYGNFTSTHEGLGVLLEEFNELADAVRANDLPAVRREAIQVAAVASRIAEAVGDAACAARSVP